MIISTPDMIGLSAGLIVWVCAIIYFLKHPSKRTATDVDIINVGWDVSVSKIEPTKGLSERLSSTKQFEQPENQWEPPSDFSDASSDVLISTHDGRKVSGGTSSSKRIDLDGCSVSRKPKKRSIKRLQNSGEYVISRHSSSVHL
jgi:hypothetical protein